jgi:uncharacterized protein YggE
VSPSRIILGRTAVVAATSLVAVMVLGVMLTSWRPAGPSSAATVPTNSSVQGITVNGTGTVTIKPDLATITIGVQAQAPSAADAQGIASAAMAKVVDAIKGNGIAEADIATQWVSLEPQYNYKNDGSTPTVIGYVSNQTVSVKVRDLARVGPVIDTAVAAGANQVSGISFSVADPSAAASQARATAIADAKARATELANAAGVTLGAATMITEVSAPGPIPYEYRAAAPAADGAGTPILPGTTEVQVDVEVTYAIG